MVVWSTWSILALAVFVSAKAAIPDPPNIDHANNRRLTTIADCTGIVAFSANKGTNVNSRVVHVELLVDKGAGYSTRTGIFTVPCSGLYLFSFAGYGGPNLRLTLKRKPRQYAWRSVVSAGPSGGSNTVLLDVDVGDQLAVYVESGKIRDATFTGYRINLK